MVAQVKVRLVNEEFMGEFYFTKNPTELAQRLMKDKAYSHAAVFWTNPEGEAAAEEVFDLTNNPSRQQEREQYYGRGRSVSVGDIVEVDGVRFLCASMGWTELA